MAEFPHLGKHCSRPGCGQLDFLPFTCDGCKKIFCLEHRSYATHNCQEGSKKDNQAFFCPECGKSINVGYGGDIDFAFSLHLEKECPSSGFQPQPEKKKVEPCLVKGCKARTIVSQTTCKLCKKPVCLSHRFEKDHNCSAKKQTNNNLYGWW